LRCPQVPKVSESRFRRIRIQSQLGIAGQLTFSKMITLPRIEIAKFAASQVK
jgi:hypothetical protein